MAAPAPAYRIFQNLLSNSFCIYDDRGPVLGYEDIPCRGEAESHVLDLMAADEAKAQQAAFDAACEDLEASLDAIIAEQQAENAHLADFDAQAHAMAYGPAVAGRAA